MNHIIGAVSLFRERTFSCRVRGEGPAGAATVLVLNRLHKAVSVVVNPERGVGKVAARPPVPNFLVIFVGPGKRLLDILMVLRHVELGQVLLLSPVGHVVFGED